MSVAEGIGADRQALHDVIRLGSPWISRPGWIGLARLGMVRNGNTGVDRTLTERTRWGQSMQARNREQSTGWHRLGLAGMDWSGRGMVTLVADGIAGMGEDKQERLVAARNSVERRG